MQRTVVLLVVALIAVGGVATLGGVAGTDGTDTGDAGVPVSGFEQMDVDPDDVLINVAVEPNGDAVWEIQYRVRLATDDEEQAFEELRADIDATPEAYTDRFRERMVATADAAEAATGREMAITDTTVTAERRELPQSYGVVTYQFRWEGFAAVDDDRLVVGDAIDGMFLDDASSLILSWPDGYEIGDVSPSPTETRDGSVVWAGPIDFTGGEPRLTVGPEGSALSSVIVVVLALLAVVVGAVAYRRRRDSSVDPVERDPAAAAGDEPTEPTASDPDRTTTETADSTSGPTDATESGESDLGDAEGGPSGGSAADGSAADGSTVDGSAADDADTPLVDEDLLSNEEQVIRLIEANGGRMKQKRVVEELDWTAAKTSQVVTGLREDGDLDGFRLGRENVLSLPDFDATADATEADADGDDEDDTVEDGGR